LPLKRLTQNTLMPNLLEHADSYLKAALAAGEVNPLGASERPSDPYAPCWCGSEKKWKFCHKEREGLPEMSFGEIRSHIDKLYQTGPCLHPAASEATCSSTKSIKSHTIQRRGGLAAIAEDGHVYSIKRGMESIEKMDGQVGLEKIGLAKASTFPGFCATHDSDMFKPIEQAGVTLDRRTGFLLSFRAIAYELATKGTQLRSHEIQRDLLDRGKPFVLQRMAQSLLHQIRVSAKKGRDDVTAWKGDYDRAFLADDLSSFRMFGVMFDRVLPFVAAGAFMPEYDFQGTKLQALGLNKASSHVALNVTPFDGKTCVVMGWTEDSGGVASKLVDSFKSVPDDAKANALLVLSLEHLENFYCTPSWWEALSSETSAVLHAKIAGGMPMRFPDALVEPDLSAVVATVESVVEA
jgi:hypothetical protein